MEVILVTQEQKQEIEGKRFAIDSYFNPIQDTDNNWIISTQEQDQCSIDWVKELPLIEYIPKPTPNLLDNI
jgi:hypothetical protein